ncbi:MAG TPA: lysophospholipid acyltransferase family protein [Bacteroidota bacterium]|nr:lysophospholipid acyltransferase family protein [Bacteroidota bacterium]
MMKKIVNGLAKKMLWLAALILCSTLRIRKSNSAFFEEHRKGHKRSVIAFWHGSMLVGWFLHRPQKGAPAAALVSQSEDGEILSAVLARWGYDLIRGSSHIGGKEAMQLMTGAIDDGKSLCITPDGPTGPRHRMKMGAVRAAQRAHVPLFLVGIAARRKKTLKSWDQFEIPMPFSRIDVQYSDPLSVPDHLQNESLDLFLAEAQDQLAALSTKAEQAVR